jgi:hypothetical protein
MEIVTPNYGLVLDTFIMYGFVRAVGEGEGGDIRLSRTRIKPEGEYYLIEVNEEDSHEIRQKFYNSLYDAYTEDVEIARGGRRWKIGALQNEEKILEELKEFLKHLVEASGQISTIFDLFQKPSTWEEWRSNRCKFHVRELKRYSKLRNLTKNYIVQLSLSPQLGKYLYKYDEGLIPEQQKVCSLCASLAILGLLSYSVRMILREAGQNSGWQFVTLIPTTNVLASDVSLFRQAFGKNTLITPPLSIDKMPEIITPLLLFRETDTTNLEVLLRSKPTLFAYRFEPNPGKPQVMAVRKVSEYPASRFIEFYLSVKRKSSETDNRLLNFMRYAKYSPFFSDLALSILMKDSGRFYSFLRGFATETRKEQEKPAFFSEVFVEQALQFYEKR